VDSSVALHLLQQQGITVRAYYLRIWLADELADLSDCPWEEDWAYCSAVCEQLKVPLEAVSVQAEYWERVVR
jgi:tRNA-specific 2-thiouridylase